MVVNVYLEDLLIIHCWPGPQRLLLFRLLPCFYNQAAYLHWLEGDNENENGIDSDSDNDSDNLLVIMIVIIY